MQRHSVTIYLTGTHAQYGGTELLGRGNARIEYAWTRFQVPDALHWQHTQPDRTAQLRQRHDRRHDNHAYT